MVARGELLLWWIGEPEVLFVYYLTGALTLSFLFTLLVTRALRRGEPCVIEATKDGGDETIGEEDCYMVSITTSVCPGYHCPDNVKVLMQLQGEYADSHFYIVKSNQGRKTLFKRGYTDIFLLRITDMIGPVEKVRLVISGIGSKVKWCIKKTELYDLKSGLKRNIPAVVMTTEVLDDPDITDRVIHTSTPVCYRLIQMVFKYHQWLAMFGNPIRYGAFTETVHLFMFFTALMTLLTSSLILYIYLPRSQSQSLDIHLSSLLISASTASAVTAVFCLILELILRSVRSSEDLTGDTLRMYNRLKRGRSMTAKQERRHVLLRPEKKRMFSVNLDGISSYNDELINKGDKSVHDKARKEWINDIVDSCRNFLSTDKVGSIKTPQSVHHSLHRRTNKSPTNETGRNKSLSERVQNLFSKCSSQARVEPVTSNSEMAASTSQGARNDLDILAEVQRTLEKDKRLPEEFHQSNKLAKYFLSSAMTPQEYIDKMSEKKSQSCTSKPDSGMKDSNSNSRVTEEKSAEQQVAEAAISSGTKLPSQYTGSHGKTKALLKTSSTPQEFIDALSQYELGIDYQISDEESEDSLRSGKKRRRGFHSFYRVYYDDIEGHGDAQQETKSREKKPVPVVRATVLEKRKKSLEMVRLCSKQDGDGFSVSDKQLRDQLRRNMKVWSRSFIKDVAETVKRYGNLSAQGSLSFSESAIDVLHWVHDLVHRICVCMVVQKHPYNKDIFQCHLYPEVVSLIFHLSSEIVLLAIQGVCKLLSDKESSLLAEMMIQSHFLMQGVQQAADSVLYCVTALSQSYDDINVSRILRHLDIDADLKMLARELIRECAGLSLQCVFVPWALIKDMCRPQSGENLEDVAQKLTALIVLAAKNELEEEYEDSRFITRICDHIVNEAKTELWLEYQNEKIVFVDTLVKHEVLQNLKQYISKLNKKKQKLEKKKKQEYERTSRKQKRMQRQLSIERQATISKHHSVEGVANVAARKLQDNHPSSKHVTWNIPETNDTVFDPNSVRKKLKLPGSKATELEVVTNIHTELKKRWQRLGYKSSVEADLVLAQALLHPFVQDPRLKDEGETEKYRFDHILMLKKKEKDLGAALSGTVDSKVKNFLQDILMKHLPDLLKTGSGNKANSSLMLCVENILVQVELTGQWMTKQLETELWKVLKALPKELDEARDTSMIVSKKATKKGGSKTSDAITFDSLPKSAELVSTAQKTTMPEESVVTDLQDIVLELKPVRSYLACMQNVEKLRNQITQRNYIEKLKQNREYFCTINLQNVIDSFFLVDDIADIRKLNRRTRYQLEHEMMEETRKPIAMLIKTVVVWTMLMYILLSIVYNTLIPGQFSVEELQEWMCYFCLSLGGFAFILEPIRAIIVGLIQGL